MKFTVAISMCDPAHYLPLARAAEKSGWDGVAVPDGVFYPEHVGSSYPYSPDGQRFWGPEVPFLDPWVVIAAMAAVTERLRFYTHVLKLPIRHPLLVAKTVGSAAVLSNNRVVLGVGVSWIPEEAAWCGQDFETRGPRTSEAIEIIRALLGGGMVEHHGRYYYFGRLQMSPPPTEPVPMYVGGHSRAALRRAARYGGGWCSANCTESKLDAVCKEIELTSKTTARGVWALYNYLLHKREQTGLRLCAFYHDEYVKVDEQWKIRHTGYRRVFEEVWNRNDLPSLKLVAG